jgi:AAA15 family ATPase/GTPase
MLIRYSYNNFCSFNANSEFSLETAQGKVKSRFPDNYTATETGYDLLKTAVIVGENAGGKSNFINSLKFLKSLFDTNSHIKSVNAYVNSLSVLKEKKPRQKFEIVFLAGNRNIYAYEIEIDSSGIFGEKLVK